MFGFRTDGKKVKNLETIFRIIPHIMTKRSDAQVYYTEDIALEPLDAYIDQKAKDGINISYMNIIYAALVRLIAEKPKLNRFVIDGRTYKRNAIYVSLMIKKEMTIESEETSIKLKFTGEENIFDVKNKLDQTISINKDLSAKNDMDKLAKVLAKIPNLVLKFIIGSFKYLDKLGLLPKAVLKASPFHTSAFLTNVGSLGIDAIYHHIYDFGNTGLFIAMGKKKKSYICEDENITEAKTISISLVADERICDGFYFANVIKSFNRLIKKPELLETKPALLKDLD
jgi:hypothetical protein